MSRLEVDRLRQVRLEQTPAITKRSLRVALVRSQSALSSPSPTSDTLTWSSKKGGHMALLNRKIRAIYAGALGALGLAAGAAFDPLSSRSEPGQAAVAPIALRAAQTSLPIERRIEG